MISALITMLVAGVLAFPAARAQEAPSVEEKYRQGHSRHGEAFDKGPRQKPWAMEGIGKTHFPVSTRDPEVQKWFDQGHTLLHSFWYYEAERAFRWAVRLDPECALAYWGLARASGDDERAAAFIREAAKRKTNVTDRERAYIEAWEAYYILREPGEDYNKRRERLRTRLEKIVLAYPDDVEAKALLALENTGRNRVGTELLIQQILAREPNHPGAHHYRIHNWDGREGAQALESCWRYGEIAPSIGHARHMPGHIYSGVGMWHEAAIAMDGATRVERQYMRQRMIFPFNNWNYAHNRNYLCYIQEQLGMPEAAAAGARRLLEAPRDPDYDNPDRYGTQWQGILALQRVLVRYERWKELVSPKTFPWGTSARDRMYKAYCETRGYLGLGDTDRAWKSYTSHAELKKELEKPDNKWLEQTHTIQALELRGMISLARGDTLTGLGLLADAAKREIEQREDQNDPPSYPNAVYNLLGRAYLEQQSPRLAAAAFERTLEVVPNDGFALSGLVEAFTHAGEKEKARNAYARLLDVWSGSEPGNPWLERARRLGIEVEPRDSSPARQRRYTTDLLDDLGPELWEPYEAPRLDAVDSTGKRVTLEEYRGKNVLLIFYLGEECPHCMEQLVGVTKRKDDFARLDTEVLAVSGNTPQQNAESLKVGKLPVRLLSDVKFENARRFQSYDDFEELALHSTILIDSRSGVHWARNGGEPFKNLDFILGEIRKMNQSGAQGAGTVNSRAAGMK